MKIALVTYECPPADFKKISFPNKKKYCEKHGYDFWGSEQKLSKFHRPSWDKILHVLSFIEGYDWIFWSDADSFVINSEIKLEQFIDNEKDFIIGVDEHIPSRYVGINSGQFFIKNTPWSINLLNTWWEQHKIDSDPSASQWDQLALKKMIGAGGESYPEKVKVYTNPRKGFNVVPEFTNPDTFIMHCRREHRNFEDKKHLIF